MKNALFTLALSIAALSLFPQTALAQSADVTAIKAVIERETTAFHLVDAAAMADCWANVPEANQLGALQDGKCTVIHNRNAKTDLPATFKQVMAEMKPTGVTFQNTDYLVRINGNAAFVQYEQTETAPDSTKSYAHQTRYLEKIEGAWKIVSVGFVYYTPGK